MNERAQLLVALDHLRSASISRVHEGRIVIAFDDAMVIGRALSIYAASPGVPPEDQKTPAKGEGDLLPCPFCGSEAEVSWYAKGKSPDVAGYFIECCSCSASGEPFDIQGEMPDRDDYTKQQAAEAWNRRALASSPKSDGWGDIGTAPKDGTRFLGCSGAGGLHLYFWRATRNWWGFTGSYTVSAERSNQPTHWRPLPAPPPSPTDTGRVGNEG